jgi:aryl-alcohol dehydrogenase-like predicted oxidoreductase
VSQVLPSALGLGCSRIGSFNNPMSDREAQRLVQAALDLGVRVLDTANIYGQGDSERVIGRAVHGRRDQAFVVTKCGLGFSARMRLLRPFKPLLRPLLARRASGDAVTARRSGEMRRSFDPAGFGASLDASLRRLGLTAVDGLLLHSPSAQELADPAIGPTLQALQRSGRLRHFGVSCDDAASLQAALALPGLTLLQLPWTLVADGQAQALAARGIAVMVREVIRLQPAQPPEAAVAGALRLPGVAMVLAGTGSIPHLRALAAVVPR